MNRRKFLKRLAALVATPVMAKVAPEVEGLAALEGQVVTVHKTASAGYPGCLPFQMNTWEKIRSLQKKYDDHIDREVDAALIEEFLSTTGEQNAQEENLSLPPARKQPRDIPASDVEV